MKTINRLLLNLILIGISIASFADYPIVSYRYLADPGSVVYDGRVYLYCSNDDENGSNYDMKSFVCVSSSDMKNWTDHGAVFQVPRDASWANLSWAPSVAYKNGKFYLYFGNGGSAIGVAVSNSPTGPFKDAINKQFVNANTPGVSPFNGWLFDPMTFVDDDGQAYMYFGGNGNDNMRWIKLNSDMISTSGSAGKWTVPNFFEASWMHKHNGKYYFSYSTNSSAGLRIDYMVSNSPTSGFTYGGVMSGQPPSNNNNNHQAVFKFNNEWYQAYHNRIVANTAGITSTYKRNLAIDKIVHQADGKITQMTNTANGLTQLGYLNPFKRVEAETMSDNKGIETEVCNAGGMNVAFIDNSDYIMVEGVDFGSGVSSFSASVASTKTGGSIEIRVGSTTGTLLGTLQVPNTGGNQTWQTVTTSVTQTTGVKNLYFVFKGNSASLFNFDHWSFASNGPKVSITSPLTTDEIFVGNAITISATATVSTGSVSNVRFYDGTTLLNTDNTSPYSYIWNGATLGDHTIKAVATDNAGNSSEATIIIKVKQPQGPYKGTAHAIPGVIQLEEYDLGGNNVAYMDDSPGSDVTPVVNYRTDEDVDIETCTDNGGGYNLGYATAGEWLEYTANVASTGKYDLDIRVACDGTGRTLSVDMGSVSIAKDVAIPNTAGWQVWQTITVKGINLTAGPQIMRLTIGAQSYINLNFVEFKGIVTGIEENGISESIQLYPNPFGEEGLQVKTTSNCTYNITDLSGAKVEEGTLKTENKIGQSLAPGLYVLQVQNGKGTSFYKITRR